MTGASERLTPLWIVSCALKGSCGWRVFAGEMASYLLAEEVVAGWRSRPGEYADAQITGPFYVKIPT